MLVKKIYIEFRFYPQFYYIADYMSVVLPQGQSAASTCHSVYDFPTFIFSSCYLGDVFIQT